MKSAKRELNNKRFQRYEIYKSISENQEENFNVLFRDLQLCVTSNCFVLSK
mgnify:CR=1 FL=1